MPVLHLAMRARPLQLPAVSVLFCCVLASCFGAAMQLLLLASSLRRQQGICGRQAAAECRGSQRRCPSARAAFPLLRPSVHRGGGSCATSTTTSTTVPPLPTTATATVTTFFSTSSTLPPPPQHYNPYRGHRSTHCDHPYYASCRSHLMPGPATVMLLGQSRAWAHRIGDVTAAWRRCRIISAGQGAAAG